MPTHAHRPMSPSSRARVRRGGIAVGTAAAMLATAAVATATPQPLKPSSALTPVSFVVHGQPAKSIVNVAIDAGLSNITSQSIAGTSLAATTAATDGFTITSTNLNNAEDIIVGQIAPGISITGHALLPPGTTMSAIVGQSAPQPISNGAFSIAVPATTGQSKLGVSHTPAPSSTISATPGIVRPGTRVKIWGDAPNNARAGQWITLASHAFASTRSLNGIPTIRTQVRANGTYSVTATVRSHLKAATYAIAGSWSGKSLAQVASIRVR